MSIIGSKFLRNAWYVAAWSHEVRSSAVLARTIVNTPIVFWRDNSGQVVALIDRCCHRAAPLSAGRLEGDNLRCMYHGLLYDPSGKCVEIPSQKFVPPVARVRAFPVVERFKWIWIWMGAAEKADESLIPDTHYLDDPNWRGKPGYLHYEANYLLIADNLLDFSHLSYVHEKTLGGSARYAMMPPKVSSGTRSVRVERWLLDDEPAPFLQKLKTWKGNVDRWNIYEFFLPGVLLMDSGSAPAGTGAPSGSRVDAACFFGIQALTPESEGTTHYFFQQSHGFSLGDPEVTEKLTASILEGFEEDKRMITSQQRVLELDPESPLVALRMDVALAGFRTLLQRAIEAESAVQESSSNRSQAVS